MRRRILIGVFLLLAIASIGAGVWSYWWTEALTIGVGQSHLFETGVTHGALAVGMESQQHTRCGYVQRYHLWTHGFYGPGHGSGFLLEWRGVESAIGVPFWLVAAIFGLAAWRVHRRRTPPPGMCVRCGYDLRATPGRCPECGSAAGQTKSQRALESSSRQ